MRRICIFALDVYEKPFRYQLYLLKKASKAFERLVVVHNGGKINLQLPISTIYCCDVWGFDVDKWKYAVAHYYDEICKYDEVIFLNDTFFGPVNEFSDFVQEMEEHDVDFWGITEHKAIYNNGMLLTGRFLQRYLMVFRQNVVLSQIFREFWMNLDVMETYQDTEKYFEFVLTDIFSQAGFKYEVYCPTNDLEPEKKEYVTSHVLFDTALLLKNRQLPIVPTYIFKISKAIALNYGIAGNCVNTLQYLKEHTRYDVDMIYEYLLATQNVYELMINLELTEVLPSNIFPPKKVRRKKIATFVYLFYEDKFAENVSRLRNIPNYVDIIIITDSASKKKSIEAHLRSRKVKGSIMVHSQRGREWGALLLTAKKKVPMYDYFCFLHDKKSGYLAYKSVARDFEDLLWDNLIESQAYIDSIISFLEKNPRVGLIVPPNCNHGIYYRQYADYWTICYENTVALANRIGIRISGIEKEQPPVSIGSCFWCRTEAFKKLLAFSFSEEDFPNEPMDIDGTINHCLERIFPYIAQDSGYFTVSAMTKRYSRLLNANNEYMLYQLSNKLAKKYNYGTFSELLDEMR